MINQRSELAKISRAIYCGRPYVLNAFQHWRPFICPFDELIKHVPQGSRVLDIGCGGGLFLALLAATGRIREGVGFDFSERAIAAGRRMNKRLGADNPVSLDFQLKTVNDPWPEGLFDVVSLVDVVHHVPPHSQSAVIQRALSKLSPGGRFVYKDMCRKPLWRNASNRLHDLVLARQWIYYFPVEQVEHLATAHGLRLIESKDITILWYGHELRVFELPSPMSTNSRTETESLNIGDR